MPRIFTSTKFQKHYKKQTEAVKQSARKQEKLFLRNAFDPQLETHKLHGKYKEAWAYSVTRKIRIKFIFVTSDIVMYLDIGTHDEVY